MTDKMSQFVLIYGMFILNGCEDCTIQRRRKRFTDIRRLLVDRGSASAFVQYTLVILREFNGRTIRYSKLLARHNALFDGCGFFENGRVADALQLTAGSREIRIDLVYRFVFPAMKSAWVSVSMTIDAIFKASCDGPARTSFKFSISYQYTCCTIMACSIYGLLQPVTRKNTTSRHRTGGIL